MFNEIKKAVTGEYKKLAQYAFSMFLTFECLWSLIYTIKSFWTWGYVCEEIGLIVTAGFFFMLFIGEILNFKEEYDLLTEKLESEKEEA